MGMTSQDDKLSEPMGNYWIQVAHLAHSNQIAVGPYFVRGAVLETLDEITRLLMNLGEMIGAR